MSRSLRLAAPFLFVIALLGGCGRAGDSVAPQTSAAPPTDENAVRTELARHPEVVDDGTTGSEEQTGIDAAATDGRFAAIRPLFFWRTIRDVDRRFEFAFGDTDSTGLPTSAVVTVHRLLHGSFNIVVGASTDPIVPGEGEVVRKPLHDHWVRRIALRRMALASGRTAWKIVAVSGVRITARDATTRIQSVRVQGGDVDTTLTEPLALRRLRGVLRFAPLTDVTLTVTTDAVDDVVVLYARGGRFRFHPNGDGTYTGTWRAPRVQGVHHVGVDALAHATLYDDQAPYDSQAWVFPYVVKPEELADALP